MTAGVANAQDSSAQISAPGAQITIPDGYVAHGSVDVGGRTTSIKGSSAMYDTLVNMQSGPRVLGENFEMHTLPGTKGTLFDTLTAVGNGFGGDPYNFGKLDFSKGKLYDFSGMFRRDRQYFDYDLLGNPGIPSGYSIPIGSSAAPTGSYAWPQVNQSPFAYNTVRRMTDTNLTILPLSKVTFRAGYSHDTFEGPSRSPSGNAVAGSEVILQEYQRIGSDYFTGGIDWKPINGTKLTFEEEIDHNKLDSYFTMDPSYFTVQEADGTKVALLDSYQNFVPYSNSSCNTGSMVNSSTILTANPNGGLPIIDPACNVISSYYRSQPTREIFPTEIFRMESTSIKNVLMNGDVRYTKANMNMPNYYENFQGLDKATRALSFSALGNAKRDVIAIDYGIVWQATKTISLADQVTFSNAHQPGTAEYTGGATGTVSTTVPNTTSETINNPNVTTTTATTGGTAPGAPGEGGPGAIGTPNYDYFAQRYVTNNATVSWDATPRSSFSLTYRYQTHRITEGSANNTSSQTGATFFTIDENGGIFNAALHPTDNWDLNGTVEVLYDNNVLTPVAPRQTKHYRVHTLYRPKSWATLSAAFNDLEQHNNTNNTGVKSAVGPLGHENHTRVVSLGANLMPNEHYGLDLNYAYNDVYTATNICFEGAATAMPGGTVAPAAAIQSGNLCYPVAAGFGSQAVVFGPAKDFEDAPTQYGSVAVVLAPNPKLHSDLGYRISSVNGSRFFTDASDVNGSMVSTYQTPFAKASWTLRPGLIWNAEYDYYGYGEGGRSGAQYCNDNPHLTVNSPGPLPVVPCSSVANTAMSSATPVYGFTAPRNFHANNVTLSMHYDF